MRKPNDWIPPEVDLAKFRRAVISPAVMALADRIDEEIMADLERRMDMNRGAVRKETAGMPASDSNGVSRPGNT